MQSEYSYSLNDSSKYRMEACLANRMGCEYDSGKFKEHTCSYNGVEIDVGAPVIGLILFAAGCTGGVAPENQLMVLSVTTYIRQRLRRFRDFAVYTRWRRYRGERQFDERM